MALRTLTAAVGAAALAVLAPLTVLSSPALAASARVSVSNQDGAAVADPTYATTLTLHGSGFQSIAGGFGGIYVLFGTVKGTWQPSKGGLTGVDYLYVPDSESKNNKGYEKFVTFPGGDTASAANGGVLKADGTWSTTIVVPGATFQALDRNNDPTTVDCLKVTCGVITIGAHGVANDHNETFTPVTFHDLYGASAGASPTSHASAGAGSGAASGTGSGGPTPPTASAPAGPTTPATPAKASHPAVSVDHATAVVGHVLSFTATGLSPGEQATASLDDGLAAVGPLTAGPSGEIAGVLQLPAGTQPGTHVLEVTGAASGAHPSVNFPIAAGTSDPAATAAPVAAHHGHRWIAYAYLVAALVVLAGAVAFALVRRGRRTARAEVSHG
jgi:hypothetical protein